MPFTNHSPIELTPDFTVDEGVYNNGDLHLMSFRHDGTGTEAFIEGSKNKAGEEPYYSFGWRATYSVEQAAKFLNDADTIQGLGATAGTYTVYRKGGIDEYEWVAGKPEEETDIEELALPTASLIRLDTGASTLGWDTGERKHTGHSRMWVITADPIDAPWIKGMFDTTVEDRTKEVVTRNLGVLTAGLNAFLRLPFGECTLDTDFRAQAA